MKDGKPGKLTISRPSTGSRSWIELRVEDETSGCNFLRLELEPEAFALALTGLSFQACEFELLHQNVGKRRETKTELVPFKLKSYATRNEEAKAALLPFETDGWVGNASDVLNHHCSAKNGHQRVAFVRFVNPQQ